MSELSLYNADADCPKYGSDRVDHQIITCQ